MYLLKTAKDFIYIRKQILQTYLLTIWSETHGTKNAIKTIKAMKNVDLNDQIVTFQTAKRINEIVNFSSKNCCKQDSKTKAGLKKR